MSEDGSVDEPIGGAPAPSSEGLLDALMTELSRTSLEAEGLAESVTHRLTEEFAEGALVAWRTPQGGMKPLAARIRDPDVAPFLEALMGAGEFSGPLTARMRSGEEILLTQTTSESLAEVVDEPFQDLLVHVDVSSLIAVPLWVRGENLGQIAVTRAARSPSFTSADLDLVQHLGRQVAVAIDNAQLRDRLRHGDQEVSAARGMLESTQRRFRAQYRSNPVPTFTWRQVDDDPDDFELIDYNEAAVAVTDGLIRESLGTRLSELYQGDAAVLDAFRRCVTDEVSVRHPAAYRFRGRGLKHLIMTYVFVPPDLVMTHMEDITERVAAEEALRESKELFERAFGDAPIGMAIIDLNGRIRQANGALAAMLGRERGDLCGCEWRTITQADDWLINSTWLEEAGGTDAPPLRAEQRSLKADGDEVPVEVSASVVRDSDGEAQYVVAQIVDVSSRRAFEAELRRAALHDPLTGLANRALFRDRLHHALAVAERSPESVAVLFVDLDNFKRINDSLGHAAGDQALIQVASRLSSVLRPGDTIARFGGDEFLILCERLTDPADLDAVVERISQVLSDPPFRLDGETVDLTASVGVAPGSGDGVHSADRLIHAADSAMYRAKAKARASHEIASAPSPLDARQRLRMEAALRDGLARGEFELVYQPLVYADSYRICGAEALIRWSRSPLGPVGPDAFIPVAEEIGIIGDIGRWVLVEACKVAANWTDRRAFLSVNLSTRQLTSPTLVEDVAYALDVAGLMPDRLSLEITESTAMEDAAAGTAVLRQLHDLGVRLAIDDFGTGFTSLSHLSRLPVQMVKIDRSFIHAMVDNREDRAIVTAVCSLAETLGLRTVAEGIETEAQLEAIQELGCDFLQGFLLHRPTAATTVLGR